MRCWITFDKTKYGESKFTMQGFADWAFSEPSSNYKGTNRKKVGVGSRGGARLEEFMKCV